MPADVETLLKRVDKLFNTTERKNAEGHWSLISEFMLPNQSGIFHGETTTASNTSIYGNATPGGKKTNRLYDSTAIQAARDLAAAINSTLTNPATKWAKMRFKDEELNNNREAQQFLENSISKMYEALNESNFDRESAKNYESYTTLGTMILVEEPNEDSSGRFNGLKFKAWHIAQCTFSENSEGVVDTVYRRLTMSARQAFERFGKELPDHIMQALEEFPEKEFDFVHCIMPRDPKEVDINEVGLAPPNKRPFASIYIEPKERKILEDGGYYELPVFVTRWGTMPGEVYGRGPGHIALPDVRTINKTKELSLRAIAKAIDPPLLANQRNVLGNLNLGPSTVTVVRDLNNAVAPFQTPARFDVTQLAIEELKNSIRQIFFLDKLLLPPRTETGEMTAFEVAQRIEQVQRVLGPTLGRLNSEFLTPLIIRTFKIMLRAGAFGEIPAIVQERGLDVDIVFINQLARSQQIEDVTNMNTLLQFAAGVGQMKPESLDFINGDEMIKHAAEVLGVPMSTITNNDEVEEARQQRAQQMQMQQALETGVQAADIQSKTGE